jgi:hypothetical protein
MTVVVAATKIDTAMPMLAMPTAATTDARFALERSEAVGKRSQSGLQHRGRFGRSPGRARASRRPDRLSHRILGVIWFQRKEPSCARCFRTTHIFNCRNLASAAATYFMRR